jgi:hypothetical protein
MSFFVEWYVAMQRAFWFPLIWALRLEAPPVQMPVEYAPAWATAEAAPVACHSRRKSRHRVRRRRTLSAA